MVPTGSDNLLHFGLTLSRGLALHPWIVSTEASPEELRLSLTNLQHTMVAVANAATTKTLATNRLAMADKALKTWLVKARLVVMLARGGRWSESWIHTGFSDRRTQIPKRLESRISLARALVSFFARHPEFGVNFAEVTAARGRAIYERAIQSCEMLELAKQECSLTKQQRNTADKKLRQLVRQFVSALKTTLDKSDSRWSDFGVDPDGAHRNGHRRSRGSHTAPIPFVEPGHRSSQGVAAA